MVDVLGTKMVVARKPHQCGLCHRVIAKGESHHTQANVYDGRAYTFRTCVHCEAFNLLTDTWGWDAYGGEEGYGPDTIEWFEPLDRYETTWQRRWRRRWTRRDGTLYPIPTRPLEAAA